MNLKIFKQNVIQLIYWSKQKMLTKEKLSEIFFRSLNIVYDEEIQDPQTQLRSIIRLADIHYVIE